jgi:hypothetical protein
MTTQKRKKVPWGDFILYETIDPTKLSFGEWFKDDAGVEHVEVYYEGKIMRPVLPEQLCMFGHGPYKKDDGSLSNDKYARIAPKGVDIRYDAEKNEYYNVPDQYKKLIEVVKAHSDKEREFVRETRGTKAAFAYKNWFRDSTDAGNGPCFFQCKLNVVNRKLPDAGRVKTNYNVVSEEKTVSLAPSQGVDCSKGSIAHYYTVYNGIAKSTMGVVPQVRVYVVDYLVLGGKPGEVSEIVEIDRSILKLPVPAKLPVIPCLKDENKPLDPINAQIQADITEEELRVTQAAEAAHFDQHTKKRSRVETETKEDEVSQFDQHMNKLSRMTAEEFEE